MKKIFFALAALVAMTACVQDEMNPDALVPPQQEQTPSDTTGTPDTPDTPDTPAVPKAKIVFNELCGNKVEYDTFAEANKFIEIYNAGDAEANLKGWTIRKYASDATDVPEKYNNCWAPVTDIKIPAGGYLVLQADIEDDPTVGFNAGLSAEKALKLELVDAEGNVVDKFLRGEDTDPFMEPKISKNEEASFSRVPNGTGDWAYAVPTPGAANGESTGEIEGYAPAPDQPEPEPEPAKAIVIFNELCGNKVEYDTFAEANKFIEIYNAGDAEANLKGWTIRKYASDATDVPEKYNNCWAPVTDIKIPAGGYLVLQADIEDDPTIGFNAGLSAEKALKLELVDAEGNVVDKFLRGEDTDPFMEPKISKNVEASFSRVPNGTGDWAYAVPTPGAANGEKTGEIEGYTPAN